MVIRQWILYRKQWTLCLIVGDNRLHLNVILMRAENRQQDKECHSVATIQPSQDIPSGPSFTTAMGTGQLDGLEAGKSSRSYNSSVH